MLVGGHVIQPLAHRVQMLTGVLPENAVNLWVVVIVEFIDVRPARDAIGLRHQCTRLITQRLALTEIIDDTRQRVHRLLQRLDDGWRHAQCAFEAAIEHVFHRPAELTDVVGTHHATTALQGVEGAADGAERVLVFGVTQEAGQVTTQRLQHLDGFFQKDFADLGVNLVRVDGLRNLDAPGRGIVSDRDRLFRLFDLCTRRIELGFQLVEQMGGLRLPALQGLQVTLG